MVFWRNSRRGGHRPLHEARGLIVRPVLMLPVESERRSKAHRLTDAARARWYALTATSVGDARGAGAAAAAVGSAVPHLTLPYCGRRHCDLACCLGRLGSCRLVTVTGPRVVVG
jgi:hypothetical protein